MDCKSKIIIFSSILILIVVLTLTFYYFEILNKGKYQDNFVASFTNDGLLKITLKQKGKFPEGISYDEFRIFISRYEDNFGRITSSGNEILIPYTFGVWSESESIFIDVYENNEYYYMLATEQYIGFSPGEYHIDILFDDESAFKEVLTK